jgi:hypothetical protein
MGRREMKRDTVFRKTLLPLLISAVCLAASGTFPCAQEKAQPDTKPRLSVGVLIDTSAHQEKVIEFGREVVLSIADGFAGVATESFVVRYADEVEALQDWSPLDTGLRSVSPRIELDAESRKNRRTLLHDALDVALLRLIPETVLTRGF